MSRTTADRPRAAHGEDVALTYFGLRNAIGIIAIALPIVLLVSGLIDGHVQESISSYYYTRMRDYLTGTMCVLGVFLFCYRFGTWRSEGLLAKVAGLAAFGVAFVHAAPAGHASASAVRLADVHLACAAVLLTVLGVLSFGYFPAAETPLESRDRMAWVYRALGVTIWLSILATVLLNWLARSFFIRHDLLFWLETVAVLAFAVSFLVKGRFVRLALRPALATVAAPFAR